MAQDMAEKYEQHVKEYVLDYYNMDRKERASDVELELYQAPKGRGQWYDHHLMAEIILLWSYSVR